MNKNKNICGKCRKRQQNGDTDWICFHHQMLDTEELKKYQNSLDHLQSKWNSDMEKVKKEGKLKLIGS